MMQKNEQFMRPFNKSRYMLNNYIYIFSRLILVDLLILLQTTCRERQMRTMCAAQQVCACVSNNLPVCTRMCRMTTDGLSNSLPQITHENNFRCERF